MGALCNFPMEQVLRRGGERIMEIEDYKKVNKKLWEEIENKDRQIARLNQRLKVFTKEYFGVDKAGVFLRRLKQQFKKEAKEDLEKRFAEDVESE